MSHASIRTLLFLCLLAFGSIAAGAGRDFTPEQLEVIERARKSEKYAANPEWPLTVDEAVTDLLTRLPSEQNVLIANMKREELPTLHHTLGRHIRNRYGLWRGNVILLVSCDAVANKEFDPDKCSKVIIEALWNELQSGT